MSRCANPVRPPLSPRVRDSRSGLNLLSIFLCGTTLNVDQPADFGDSRRNANYTDEIKRLHYCGLPRRTTREWIETIVGLSGTGFATVSSALHAPRCLAQLSSEEVRFARAPESLLIRQQKYEFLNLRHSGEDQNPLTPTFAGATSYSYFSLPDQ